ncbi:MAG: antitoxin [Candidatus Hydrogenedentes bacterium]|nr:antitoxin [Candidatus Hydrogenedentota bacterium]
MSKTKLDKEERALQDSFERGEWHPLQDRDEELARHRLLARNTLRKDRRVNIRISSQELDALQRLASEDGIPHQTLMSSVLHRYATGRLAATRRRNG